jgi:hypothetical protein
MTVRAPAIEIFDSTLAVLQRGAELLADSLRTAIADRGRATLALSGGRTPVPMFGMLAAESLPWGRIQVFQVDERVAPRGHAERNSTAIEAAFAHTGVATHWMPVELEDLEAAARDYARELETAAGSPPVLDVVQLGLGACAHGALARRCDRIAARPTAVHLDAGCAESSSHHRLGRLRRRQECGARGSRARRSVNRRGPRARKRRDHPRRPRGRRPAREPKGDVHLFKKVNVPFFSEGYGAAADRGRKRIALAESRLVPVG